MSTATMKAVRIHAFGGPEVLSVEEVPVPQPGEGQVLVRVHAAGVNPADWKMGAGSYQRFMPLPLPWTPGLEGAGVVEAVGSGVTQFKPGQAVFGAFMGAYAEYALANAGDLQPKPGKLSFAEAATIPVGALTAWGAVVDTAQVKAGQRVLVHGAAGGVGLFAVQLAHGKGAHVIGTVSAGNLDFVRSLGADEVIDYTAGPFEKAVHEVDVVIDTVGGDVPEHSLPTLRKGGIFVTVAAMPPEDFGKAQGIRFARAGRAAVTNLGEIRELFEKGKLRPVVGKVFPLAQARQAQELSQTGHGRGRIVLQML